MEIAIPNRADDLIAESRRDSSALPLPWYCLAVVFGATCIPIGALWDISWHSTIGRDTFWTPAHITIHLGGLIPAFTAGWLALRATYFGTAEERAASVHLGPFRAPLGAWVIIWGAFAMLLSAPFDDWWHNAYGLDVEILSPPHTILAAGMYAVAIGAMLLVLSYQNRTGNRVGSLLFIYTTGVLLAMATIIVTEKSYPNHQRGSFFYQVSCAIYPLYLVAAARAAKVRWAATGAALVYMGIVLAMVWVLPLFRAQPMLAPIYNPVTRMVPPTFPLLLVIPGLAIDLVMRAMGGQRGFWRDSLLAVVLGCAFLATFLAAQYSFSGFMLTPAADNWFFAANRWVPYFARPGDWRSRFWDLDKDALTVTGLGIALALGIFKSRIALALGSWMSKVQR
jgi:hypothetical protein